MKSRDDYEDAAAYIQAQILRRRRIIAIISMVILLMIAGALSFFFEFYKVRNVTVVGSHHYTDQEVAAFVMDTPLGRNSMYLSLRYRNRNMTDIPFIEQLNVDIVSRDTIKIIVYEQSLTGYVNYLGRYMYFSRDGTVVESSSVALRDVPEILGLTFDHITLFEKLPVRDDSVFGRILTVTQLLDKYELHADKIYFDDNTNMTLYFGDIRVRLGQDNYTDEKLSRAARIFPSLEGKEGTLELSGYTPDTNYITFRQKNMPVEPEDTGEEDSGETPDGGTADGADDAESTDDQNADAGRGSGDENQGEAAGGDQAGGAAVNSGADAVPADSPAASGGAATQDTGRTQTVTPGWEAVPKEEPAASDEEPPGSPDSDSASSDNSEDLPFSLWEAVPQDTASQDTASQNTSSQDMTSQDMSAQETASQETVP